MFCHDCYVIIFIITAITLIVVPVVDDNTIIIIIIVIIIYNHIVKYVWKMDIIFHILLFIALQQIQFPHLYNYY